MEVAEAGRVEVTEAGRVEVTEAGRVEVTEAGRVEVGRVEVTEAGRAVIGSEEPTSEWLRRASFGLSGALEAWVALVGRGPLVAGVILAVGTRAVSRGCQPAARERGPGGRTGRIAMSHLAIKLICRHNHAI